MCVCNLSPRCIIWPNYEVVGLKPRSGITPALDSVAFFICLYSDPPWYYTTRLIHRTGSSTHLGANRLLPSIAIHHMRSSSHTSVARIHPRITNFPLYCTWCNPHTLMRVPLVLSYPPPFLQYLIQGCTKLCFHRLLTPPFILPSSSPPIYLILCTKLKNWTQHHPLYHCNLLSPYVGHLWLS